MSTDVTVAVVVYTNFCATARKLKCAQASVTIEVESTHSVAVSTGLLLLRKADLTVSINVVAATEGSKHFAGAGDFFSSQLAVFVEIEGEYTILSTVIASVVVEVYTVSSDGSSATPEPVFTAYYGPIKISVIGVDRSVDRGGSPAAAPAAAILMSVVNIDVHIECSPSKS